jgi:hypothetical protein
VTLYCGLIWKNCRDSFAKLFFLFRFSGFLFQKIMPNFESV